MTLSEQVRVGTSGYSFEDWRGNFYPQETQTGKMLDYYAQHFNTVEINSTYYRIPHPVVFANMLKKVPENFDFMVKVPQSLTHRRTNLETDRRQFHESIRPLVDTNKLSGLLAQFPYSFKFGPETLDYISLCREAMSPHPLFVEFRHNSWVNRTMYDRLKTEGIGYVCVDEPDLPGLIKPDLFATSDIAYLRLHGRNGQHWWEGGDSRYDYLYNESELMEWREKVAKVTKKVKTAYVFFNNCPRGQAVKNAVLFSVLMRS